MGRLWDRVRELTFSVDGYSLAGHELATSSGYRRLTTVVHLAGGGEVGSGEDVSYGAEDQIAFRERGVHLSLAGKFELQAFSAHLGDLDLFPDAPSSEAYRDYRRWAFESAAFDLALRQNGLGVEQAFGLEARPLRFALSLGLHDFGPIEERLALHANARFKLDATSDWDAALCRQLAETNAVDVIDFKGAYRGTPVDTKPDVQLYERVLDAMPEVIVEDPHDTAPVRELLVARGARVAWDAPIHSMADVDAMPLASQAINLKPSRFGELESLLEAYEACAERRLPIYGGGQFELGIGRRQIQLLAALFHPDGSNDVAPRGYHALDSPEPRPASPMAVKPRATGFAVES